MSGVLGCGPKLPLSQRSKLANSSRRRQRRMGLAVALHLRDLVHRLPAHPPLRHSRGRAASSSSASRRRTSGRSRDCRCAGSPAAGRPSSSRMRPSTPRASPGSSRVVLGDRHDLVGLVLAVAEDDVAVQVVAAGLRRPLEADEGREAARLVVLLRRGGDASATSSARAPSRSLSGSSSAFIRAIQSSYAFATDAIRRA